MSGTSQEHFQDCQIEVCTAIIDEYREEVVLMPNTQDGWRDVASKFSEKLNVHNVIGAMDGKHVAIKAPKEVALCIIITYLYHNYKGFFSMILLALVDADYKFMWYNI